MIQTLNNGHNVQIPMHVVLQVDCLYLEEVLLGEMPFGSKEGRKTALIYFDKKS